MGVAAFCPAFALMAIRLAYEAPVVAAGWLALALLGLLSTGAVLWTVRSGNAEPIVFGDIEDAGSEVVGHVASYIIPIVVDPSQSPEQVVIATVSLLTIFWIHIATGKVLVSPLLYAFGRRAYVGCSVQGPTYFLVARSDPALWGERPVACRPVGAAILVEAPPAGSGARTEGGER